ncbi:MAG: lytic murein transglycosylase [Micromonosporaceae bacterium]
MGSAVRRLPWRGAPLVIAGIMVALGGIAVAGGAVLLETSGHGAVEPSAVPSTKAGGATMPVPRPPAADPGTATALQVAPLRRIVRPDLLLVSPKGITAQRLARIGRLAHVRDVITADGGAIRLEARLTNVLAVDPSRFRSWTPPPTAANERIWASLARNKFVLSSGAEAQLRLRSGTSYQMVGAAQPLVTLGASAALGIPGVDALVSQETGHVLGLVPNVAAMVNAAGADVPALVKKVRAILGRQSQVINLDAASQQLPVDSGAQPGRPATYLDLYKQSAARYCPGLSWTILAAIGQIESGHGQNDGPSKAGALGPMQFLPSTWRVWGIPGFGDTTADIMNPYDAVPSAARYLCASGAAAGGQSLARAIFAYNHADWYVREVLALAQAYAKQFG